MKLRNICTLGAAGALLLALSSAAMAAGTTDTSSVTPYNYTSSNTFDGDTVGLTINGGATTNVDGSSFDSDPTGINNSGILTITNATFEDDTKDAIESSGETTIDDASFTSDSGNVIDVTGGTTIIDNATFTSSSGNLINASGGTTSIYGVTLTSDSGVDLDADGGVIDLYGNFGALNGTSLTANSTNKTVSGILQNDGTTSDKFLYDISDGGVINFLPLPVTSTPEPSSLTVFAIAGIALAGLAGMRRRVRA